MCTFCKWPHEWNHTSQTGKRHQNLPLTLQNASILDASCQKPLTAILFLFLLCNVLTLENFVLDWVLPRNILLIKAINADPLFLQVLLCLVRSKLGLKCFHRVHYWVAIPSVPCHISCASRWEVCPISLRNNHSKALWKWIVGLWIEEGGGGGIWKSVKGVWWE